MAELKCPHCGQAFTVDNTELNSIVQQIRDREFEKELDTRAAQIEKHMIEKHKLELQAQQSEIVLKNREAHEKELRGLREELGRAEEKALKLQTQLDSSEDKKKDRKSVV